ncbi:MAG: hypothetical protein AAGA20_15330 [Planctomycetota bacterium]
MGEAMLEITASGSTHRVPLRPGLTRIGPAGGRGVDVGIEGATGELHVWDEPPKVVRVLGDDALVVDGDMVEEALLADGAVFAWSGAKFRFEAPTPVLEEIVDEPAVPAPAPQGGLALGPDEQLAWERLAAGLLVETGLADKKAASRWQSAIMRHEWDPDAAARDILGSSGSGTSEPRFLERAGRIERDLVMASFQRGMRGATRRARGAARNTTAFFVANVVAILVYSAIILALLILVRVNYDVSLDGIIDGMVNAVTP